MYSLIARLFHSRLYETVYIYLIGTDDETHCLKYLSDNLLVSHLNVDFLKIKFRNDVI